MIMNNEYITIQRRWLWPISRYYPSSHLEEPKKKSWNISNQDNQQLNQNLKWVPLYWIKVVTLHCHITVTPSCSVSKTEVQYITWCTLLLAVSAVYLSSQQKVSEYSKQTTGKPKGTEW